MLPSYLKLLPTVGYCSTGVVACGRLCLCCYPTTKAQSSKLKAQGSPCHQGLHQLLCTACTCADCTRREAGHTEPPCHQEPWTDSITPAVLYVAAACCCITHCRALPVTRTLRTLVSTASPPASSHHSHSPTSHQQYFSTHPTSTPSSSSSSSRRHLSADLCSSSSTEVSLHPAA
jgi:hypothetical protein